MARIGILVAMILLWALAAHEAWVRSTILKSRNPIEHFKIEGNTFEKPAGVCIGIGPEAERRCLEAMR